MFVRGVQPDVARCINDRLNAVSAPSLRSGFRQRAHARYSAQLGRRGSAVQIRAPRPINHLRICASARTFLFGLSGFQFARLYLVHIAPDPGLAGLDRAYERMLHRMEVLGGMFVFG